MSSVDTSADTGISRPVSLIVSSLKTGGVTTPLATVPVSDARPVIATPSVPVSRILTSAAILDTGPNASLGQQSGYFAPLAPKPKTEASGVPIFQAASTSPGVFNLDTTGVTRDTMKRASVLASQQAATTPKTVKGGDWLLLAGLALGAYMMAKHPGAWQVWK